MPSALIVSRVHSDSHPVWVLSGTGFPPQCVCVCVVTIFPWRISRMSVRILTIRQDSIFILVNVELLS